MQLTVFTAGMAMASANSNMAESSAHEAQQLRGNNQVMEPILIDRMYHSNSSHPQGKLNKLWNTMHKATTSMDPQTIHTMERRFGTAMHSLQKGCEEDWNNLCSEEIVAETHRVHAMKLSFPYTHVNMTRVVCLANKYDQVSSHCKTTIALLDLKNANFQSYHYESHHLSTAEILLFAPVFIILLACTIKMAFLFFVVAIPAIITIFALSHVIAFYHTA